MSLIFYSSLFILILLFGIQLGFRFLKIDRERFLHIIRIISFASVCLIFTLLFYYSRQQFFAWHEAGPPAQYLVPPFSGIGYFLYYVLMRFWAAYLVSLGAALLFFYIVKKLNQKYEEKFFYPEEYYFLATAIFLTSHPGWILYLALSIVIFLIIHLIVLTRNFAEKNAELRRKVRVSPRQVRVSLRYLWLPAAILVILLSRWPVLIPLFQVLKF
jgi:hypothetical protein